MKKLMLLALAVIGLVVADASAGGWYGRRYGRCGYDRCNPCPKVCNPCKPCERLEINEQPKGPAKCCVRYVRVEQPCQWTKHVNSYYTCECPTECEEEGLGKSYETEVVGQ